MFPAVANSDWVFFFSPSWLSYRTPSHRISPTERWGMLPTNKSSFNPAKDKKKKKKAKENTISRLRVAQRVATCPRDPNQPQRSMNGLYFIRMRFCFLRERHAASNLKPLARCSQILSAAESSVLFIMHAALDCPHE